MVGHDLMGIDYLQPDFYHFDEDSISLAKFMANELQKKRSFKPNQFLEIGAGCGVISLELSKSFPNGDFELIELQESFKEIALKNIRNFGEHEEKFHYKVLDFLDVEYFVDFPVIFTNPPYFYEEDSRPSKDEKRNICRRMKKDLWNEWLFKMSSLLSPEGSLFFCHKKDDFHSAPFHLREVEKKLLNETTFYHWEKMEF